jgi:hypothetical protein
MDHESIFRSGEAWAEKRPGAAFEEILTRFSERRIGKGPWWDEAVELLSGKIAVGGEKRGEIIGAVVRMPACGNFPSISEVSFYRKAGKMCVSVVKSYSIFPSNSDLARPKPQKHASSP